VTDADPDDVAAIATEAAVRLCSELLTEGVPGLHLYCLNRAAVAVDVLSSLDGARID
jgi:methylenetetrahydrofolate reductase (NADPH)